MTSKWQTDRPSPPQTHYRRSSTRAASTVLGRGWPRLTGSPARRWHTHRQGRLGAMPIRETERARYPENWKEISATVRAEAGDKCEWCGVQNGSMIMRGSDCQDGVSLPAYRYANAPVYDYTFHAKTGQPIPGANWDTFDANARGPVRVVLTVAHLDHQPENCERSNLRALCQSCHNSYDAPMRRRGIQERARAARACSDMFKED